MPNLSLEGTPADLRPTAAYAASLIHALARDEAAGRRPPRLTEPGMPTWKRFRGRLNNAELVTLLLEDAAAIQGFEIPFSPAHVSGELRLDRLPGFVVNQWLEELASLALDTPATDYITAQARLLGVPTRLARSDLHAVKSHQKVLELPGTGGQLAHHLASTQDTVSLQDNITVACATWQERTLAGIIALDLGAPNTDFAVPVNIRDLRDANHPLRQKQFDYVVGLHPDKGGMFQAADQLDIWFSGARILLV